MNRKELMEKRSELVNKLDSVSTADELSVIKQEMNDINAKIEAKNMASEFKSADAGESKEVAKHLNFGTITSALASGRIDGFLAEISNEGRKSAINSGVDLGSESSIVLSPKHLNGIMNATLTTLTDSNGGGNAIATDERGYIQKLRDRMVITGLGAQMIDDLVDDVDFTAELAVAQAVWDAETDTVSDTSATFTKRTLSPKRLAAYLPISNKWLKQTPEVRHRFIEAQLINAVAEKIEAAAIAGTGSNDQPTGILSSGATALFAGNAAADNTNANGAALVYQDIVALEKAISVNNADVGSLAFLTNAKVRAALKTTAIAAEDAERVWLRGASELEGYNVGVTNLVPSNITKGLGTTLSALIFGNFNDLVIGQWGGIEILQDPYTSALAGITRMIVNHYVDVMVRRPDSFAFIDDIIA